uniref:Hordoindoline b-1 n=1 Tax=Hordeum vulgare subsp. vulgare TaxID=112509 RepID=H6UET4_HORVV|nr:hordoindoline-B1 [Hordeum vulgare subsp. vulgare]AOW69365.1 hordoindoline b-1 [Hordeum vulgare subsp. vulgare]AOW69366.1 hordoindoline b-1 [Hordeum vulgare subsp. vulgare]AOW69367.1 hordoindoline b-1 [Hordeum vulgare subsp. vulgare]
MKTLFLLALLALVASITFAQYSVGGGYNDVGGGGGSQQCPQERPNLGSCKDYVMERCFRMKDFPLTWPTKWWKGGCEQEVREKCCQQLSQIAPQCRCDAIRGVIRGKLGGIFGIGGGDVFKQIQRAQILPSKCNMGADCKFPSGYYW